MTLKNMKQILVTIVSALLGATALAVEKTKKTAQLTCNEAITGKD